MTLHNCGTEKPRKKKKERNVLCTRISLHFIGAVLNQSINILLTPRPILLFLRLCIQRISFLQMPRPLLLILVPHKVHHTTKYGGQYQIRIKHKQHSLNRPIRTSHYNLFMTQLHRHGILFWRSQPRKLGR